MYVVIYQSPLWPLPRNIGPFHTKKEAKNFLSAVSKEGYIPSRREIRKLESEAEAWKALRREDWLPLPDSDELP